MPARFATPALQAPEQAAEVNRDRQQRPRAGANFIASVRVWRATPAGLASGAIGAARIAYGLGSSAARVL
jgi:hypothetical protein